MDAEVIPASQGGGRKRFAALRRFLSKSSRLSEKTHVVAKPQSDSNPMGYVLLETEDLGQAPPYTSHPNSLSDRKRSSNERPRPIDAKVSYQGMASRNAPHDPATSRRPATSSAQRNIQERQGLDRNVWYPASNHEDVLDRLDQSPRLPSSRPSTSSERLPITKQRRAPPLRKPVNHARDEIERPRTGAGNKSEDIRPRAQKEGELKSSELAELGRDAELERGRSRGKTREETHWREIRESLEIERMAEWKQSFPEYEEWDIPGPSRHGRSEQEERKRFEQEFEERNMIWELERQRLLELDLWIEGQKEWERQKSLRLQIERDEQMALELEHQFALELEELERQRALEREHQAELERQRQAEIARQEREERQRQAEIARQQREERQRQAEIARQQREEQELRERELRRLQDALVRQVGAQVEVRRVYGASLLSPGGAVTDQLSSAILTQLSHVKQNFAKNLPNIPIKKIEYIFNDALYKIFNNTKAELRKHKKNTKEVLLFHGTSPNNVDR